MSNENEKRRKSGPRRPYELKARARRKEEVRRRITLAAVHLHETVGPARTTMNAIAEHAGVQRATVYNHFPTEVELIDACSTHWFTDNPPPDQTVWLQIQDPVDRTRRTLLDMYGYYERGQEMLGKVLRDAAVVPAMDQIRRQKWLPLLEGIIDILVEGWIEAVDRNRNATADKLAPAQKKQLQASLRVALDFFTWQILAKSGLSAGEAAKLAAAWIEAGYKRPT